MSSLTDQTYLLQAQYRDSSNLDARITVHLRFSSNKTGWFRWYFEQLLQLPPAARVLDIGCGPARLWSDQFYRVPAGWHITLADLSPGMIEQARSNLAAAGADNDQRFAFRTADAQILPFDDDTFDAVFANHMLYHAPDIPRALAEIRRVLRPTGRLYAATNGDGHMAELNDLVAPFESDKALPPGPVRRFGLENGEEQLARWFVRIERRDYPDSLEITEAGPLVAYALSTSGMLWMPEGEPSAEELTRHFEALLARDGVIHIGKSTGLFIAVKPPLEKSPK